MDCVGFVPGWAGFGSAATLGEAASAYPAAEALYARGWAFGIAACASLVSLICSFVAIAATPLRVEVQPPAPRPGSALLTAAKIGTLVFGLLAFVILTVLVTMRVILQVLEVRQGGPLQWGPRLVFDASGLAVIASVALACWLLLRATRSALLIVPLFWVLVLACFWGALLIPAFLAVGGKSGPLRGGGSVVLSAAIAVVLCAFVAVQGRAYRRQRQFAMRNDPDRLIEPYPTWPGFRLSAGAVGVWLIFLCCYHLAAPVEIGAGGYRLAALIMAIVATAGGVALFVLVGRRWNENLADAAMGLMSLAPCSAAMLALPAAPAKLSERFPLVFNAVVMALALMTWMWIWLSRVWQQQLDDGRAWTTTGHLARPAGRFGFFTGAIAVLVAMLMALWPRFPMVPVYDDRPGRLAAGIGGCLLLCLATIAAARRTHRPTFAALAVLSTVALFGFVIVRLLPHASIEK